MKSKTFRSILMSSEADLAKHGLILEILKRGRLVVLPAPFKNGQKNKNNIKHWEYITKRKIII